MTSSKKDKKTGLYMNFLNLVGSFGGQISVQLALPPATNYADWCEKKGPPYVMWNGKAREIEYMRIEMRTEDEINQSDSIGFKGEFEAEESDLTSAWGEAQGRGLETAPQDRLGGFQQLAATMGPPPSFAPSIATLHRASDVSTSAGSSSDSSLVRTPDAGGRVVSAAVHCGLKSIKKIIQVKLEKESELTTAVGTDIVAAGDIVDGEATTAVPQSAETDVADDKGIDADTAATQSTGTHVVDGTADAAPKATIDAGTAAAHSTGTHVVDDKANTAPKATMPRATSKGAKVVKHEGEDGAKQDGVKKKKDISGKLWIECEGGGMKLAKVVSKAHAIKKDCQDADSDWSHAVADITRNWSIVEKNDKLLGEHNKFFELMEYSTFHGTAEYKAEQLTIRKTKLEKGLAQMHAIVSPLVGMYCLRMQAKANPPHDDEV